MLDLWADISWLKNLLKNNSFLALLTRFFVGGLYWFFYVPIFAFYLHAPSFIGGWSNQTVQDICSAKTGVQSEFWIKNIGPCQDLIESSYQSWLSPILIIIYLTLILKLVFCLANILYKMLLKVSSWLYNKIPRGKIY
jgi:hypothetical protein